MEYLKEALTYIQGHLAGGAVAGGSVVFLIAAAYYAPVYLAKLLKRELDKLHASGWLESHPKRTAMWVAVMEWLEYEIPNKGTGTAFYAKVGNYIALVLSRIIPPILVLGGRIGTVLEKCGDQLDECIHLEIARYKPPS